MGRPIYNICKHNPVYKSVCMLQDLIMQANNVKITTISVKVFAGNKFHGRGTYMYRWDIRVKKVLHSAPYAKIFIPAYYIILPIYVESFSWQYTAALRGSYIVDIVSRARLLRRHWSVSVDHWQWRVKTRLWNLHCEIFYVYGINMVRYEAERN